MINQSHNSEDLLNQFRLSNIGFIHTNVRRFQSTVPSILDEDQLRIWTDFSKENLSLVYFSKGYGIWKIKI